jgi:hypothetical protein
MSKDISVSIGAIVLGVIVILLNIKRPNNGWKIQWIGLGATLAVCGIISICKLLFFE